jgi:hypothetical protein
LKVDRYVRVDGVPYPVITDEGGVERFPENPIVRWLLDSGGVNLNALALAYLREEIGPKTPELRRAYAEFYMMLGYSVRGFEELSSHLEVGVERLSDMDVLALSGASALINKEQG